MARCSLVQVGLSQASRAVAIVPMLKQNGRNAEGQSRAPGSVHSTAATQGGATSVIRNVKGVDFLFQDGEAFVSTPALSFLPLYLRRF